MKWHSPNRGWVDIDRDTARRIDKEQHREHMPRAVVESIIAMAACKNVMKTHKQQISRWARKTKGYAMLAQAIGLLDKAVERMVNHALVEQVCTIQHNTSNVWVNVSARKELQTLNVQESDLAKLMCAARGGLRDENGTPANCHNCPHWTDRSVWQNCELYHLIQRIPCSTAEMPIILPEVCPYTLAESTDDQNGGMDLES